MRQNVIRERSYRVRNNCATPMTIRLIGKAITDGSQYIPIRNISAMACAKAPRKNYTRQAQEVFKEFLKKWRYVKDPDGTELVHTSPKSLYNLVIGRGRGLGGGLGAGDCDDATAALGAMFKSVGFPVRIATMAPKNMPGMLFSHVFPQINIVGNGQNLGWVTADPVLFPNQNFGEIAPYSRLGIWNLKGQLIGTSGVNANKLNRYFRGE